MILFTVNPIIFGEVWTAKKYVICWNIKTYENMDVTLLHPVWTDFLDSVNTVVLTEYWKQLNIFLFVIQCFFQSGSDCGSWTKIIVLLYFSKWRIFCCSNLSKYDRINCKKYHHQETTENLYFLWFFFIFIVSQ
jgi:hypothetical protein